MSKLKTILGAGVAMAIPVVLAVRAEAPLTSNLVGAAACGECHRNAYQSWSATAHSQANKRLPQESRNDSRCLRCHGTPDGATGGVQCEHCHGAGFIYAKRHVMKDKELAHMVGLVKAGLDDCRRCHTESSPALRSFASDAAWLQIKHGLDPKPVSP